MTEGGPREVAVEVWRGPRIESRHRVHVAVVDRHGRLRQAHGDVDRLVYPRSSIKPFQALPLVESGAADAFGLGEPELALACASHGGEPMHVGRIEHWLRRLDLDGNALACGPQLPSHGPSAEALLRAGGGITRLHNNCSGKHTGMLSVCRHLGWPVAGYQRPDHPLQTKIAAGMAELADLPGLTEPGIDGCSLPAWVLSLRACALLGARLADPAGLEAGRASALRRLAAAMRKHPELVAGTGRACTILMRAVPEIVVKAGAEGFFLAAWPAAGLGVALKVEDGAGRAAEVALVAVLDAVGAIPDASRPAIADLAAPAVRDRNGAVVGRIRAAAGWPGAMA